MVGRDHTAYISLLLLSAFLNRDMIQNGTCMNELGYSKRSFLGNYGTLHKFCNSMAQGKNDGKLPG